MRTDGAAVAPAPGRVAGAGRSREAAHPAACAGVLAIALLGTATPEELSKAHLIVDSLRELSPQVIAKLIDSPERRN